MRYCDHCKGEFSDDSGHWQVTQYWSTKSSEPKTYFYCYAERNKRRRAQWDSSAAAAWPSRRPDIVRHTARMHQRRKRAGIKLAYFKVLASLCFISKTN